MQKNIKDRFNPSEQREIELVVHEKRKNSLPDDDKDEDEEEESTDAETSDEDYVGKGSDALDVETPKSSVYVPDTSDSDDVMIIEKPKFSLSSKKKADTENTKRGNVYIESDDLVR